MTNLQDPVALCRLQSEQIRLQLSRHLLSHGSFELNFSAEIRVVVEFVWTIPDVRVGIIAAIGQTPPAKGTRTIAAFHGKTSFKIKERLLTPWTLLRQNLLMNFIAQDVWWRFFHTVLSAGEALVIFRFAYRAYRGPTSATVNDTFCMFSLLYIFIVIVFTTHL